MMFSFFKPKYKVLTINDFECSGMTGFTFKYPVFKGWEPSLARNLTAVKNVCTIFLNHPEGILFEVPPRIIITKKAYGTHDFEIPAAAASNLNPRQVPYMYTNDQNEGNFLAFYAPDFKVFVEIQSTSEEFGFSDSIFWKSVIDSFELSK